MDIQSWITVKGAQNLPKNKAQFTHNIFAHNIEVKRYWNKKAFLIKKKFFVKIKNIYFWTIMLKLIET